MPFDVKGPEAVAQLQTEAIARGAELSDDKDGKSSTKAPVVRNVEEMLKAQVHKPAMLVEKLVPSPGVSLVVAPLKTGKTLLSFQIGTSVATGYDVCGRYQVRKAGPVLFVEKDDPGGDASIQVLLNRSRLPVREAPFFTVTDIDLTLGHDLTAWLDTEIRDRQLVLVVLDSYTALRGTHSRGGDIVKVEQTDLTQLDQLAKKHGIAILLIHHYSKGSVNHDWSERAAGTFAMGAASEAQIAITRFPDLPSDANERLVRVRGRHVAGSEIVLRLDPETLMFEHVLEGGAAPYYTDLVQLRATFSEAAFSPKSLMTELGMAHTTAHRLLTRLQAAGAIRKIGHGEYKLEVSP